MSKTHEHKFLRAFSQPLAPDAKCTVCGTTYAELVGVKVGDTCMRCHRNADDHTFFFAGKALEQPRCP